MKVILRSSDLVHPLIRAVSQLGLSIIMLSSMRFIKSIDLWVSGTIIWGGNSVGARPLDKIFLCTNPRSFRGLLTALKSFTFLGVSVGFSFIQYLFPHRIFTEPDSRKSGIHLRGLSNLRAQKCYEYFRTAKWKEIVRCCLKNLFYPSEISKFGLPSSILASVCSPWLQWFVKIVNIFPRAWSKQYSNKFFRQQQDHSVALVLESGR